MHVLIIFIAQANCWHIIPSLHLLFSRLLLKLEITLSCMTVHSIILFTYKYCTLWTHNVHVHVAVFTKISLHRIERTIHDHITSLRDRFITRWNRHCSQVLHTLLPRLEESFPASPPHTELNEITASYKVYIRTSAPPL